MLHTVCFGIRVEGRLSVCTVLRLCALVSHSFSVITAYQGYSLRNTEAVFVFGSGPVALFL